MLMVSAHRLIVVGLLLGCANHTVAQESNPECQLQPTPEVQTEPLKDAFKLLAARCQISLALPEQLPNIQVPTTGLHTVKDWLRLWLSDPHLLLSWQALDAQHFIVQYQRPSPPPEQPVSYAPELEQMLVVAPTGSHLRTFGHEVGSVQRLPDKLLSHFDGLSLSQVLRYAPQASAGSSSVQLGSASNATASLALRGLPANNTLVLVDGQRTAGNGFSGDSVDINGIPKLAVAQIDVLTGSNSAIYGSDAIAGTVNFKLRDKVDGLSFKQSWGESAAGDLSSRVSELLWGSDEPHWSRFIALSHRQQDGAKAADRSLSASSDARSLGGLDNRSTATGNSRIYWPNGQIFEAQPSGFEPLAINSDTPYFDYAPYTLAIAPLEQSQLFVRSRLQINPQNIWDSHLSYSLSESSVTHAPTPIETATHAEPLIIQANNIYNPFTVPLTDVRRRMTELGPRQQHSRSENWRLNSQWLWQSDQSRFNLKGHYSLSQADQGIDALVNHLRLMQGLSGPETCSEQTACVPINLLAAQGDVDSAQLAYLETTSKVYGQSSLASLTADLERSFDGLWPAATGIDTVIGVNLRREASRINGRQPEAVIGANQHPNLQAQRDIIELYSEANLGLHETDDQSHQIHLNGALRGAHYSDFGSHWAPQVALSYHFAQQLELSGQVSQGYRAPSLIEQYQQAGASQIHLYDLCSRSDYTTFDGCQQQSDPYQRLANTQLVGNPELSPEQSKHLGASIAWQPANLSRWLQAFDLRLSYYKTYQSDVITAVSPALLVTYDALGFIDGQVLRDKNGNVQMIYSTAINGGERQIEGIDYSLNLSSSDTGHWQWYGYLQASQLLTLQEHYLSGQVSDNYIGSFVDVASGGYGALPDWKLIWGVGGQYQDWRLDFLGQYISGLSEPVPQLQQTRDTPSWHISNMTLTWTNLWDHIDLSLSVGNLFNQSPPFSAAAASYNFDNRSFDVSGRHYRVSFSLDF